MARTQQTARKVYPAGTPKKKPKMDSNGMASAASTATPARAAGLSTNSGASSHGLSLEDLIQRQVAALESKVDERVCTAVDDELKEAKEDAVAALTTEYEAVQERVCDQVTSIVKDAGKELQSALLENAEAVRDAQYKDLKEQLQEATRTLEEWIEVSEAQAARIQDLKRRCRDQDQQLEQKEEELQETKQKLEEKGKELDQTKRKLEEKQHELEKERELSNLCSHEEKQGLEARVKRIEAALFGQKERGEMASEQELDRSFVEVIPATSPTASPSRHQETLRRARNSSIENDGSHLPTAKRGCAGLSRANRVFDESDSSEALIAGENDEGGAGE